MAKIKKSAKVANLVEAVLTRNNVAIQDRLYSNKHLKFKKMKKLGKLIINPEKVIKNDELVNLRGGDYSGEICVCSTSSGFIGNILLPAVCSTSGCTIECKTVFGSQYPDEIIVGLCKPSS